MKIPLEWLKEYVNTNKSAKEIARSFTLLGLLLDKIEDIDGNEVLDLEHRMDRSDWLSILGCARDFAAFEGLEFKYPNVHKDPGKPISEEDKVRIQVDCPDLVKRFNTKVFHNVKVKESPNWLKNRLKEYGIASINNIVDITNYVMIEYGQPMHAQDIDKMERQEIVIRRARQGETLTTLLGETVNLDDEAFVLTQNDKPTVLGGIVGGQSTAVDETTTKIVLDAGNYNQTNVRRSSRRYKIQNETVLRYDKFLHPMLTQKAIERATYLILELAQPENGKVEYFENEDWYKNKEDEKEMTLTLNRLTQMSGMQFELNRVKEILESLEYEVLDETKDNEGSLTVKVPYFRTDVEVEDDLVADVLRINSYENIPITPINTAPPKEITPAIYKFEEKLRTLLLSLGFHEHISDPLVPVNSHDENDKKQIVLENALSSEKSALRTSAYETLIPVVRNYKKHKMVEVKIFEIGSVYFNDNIENRVIEIIVKDFNASVYENSRNLKSLLAAILQNLGISDYEIKIKDKNAEIWAESSLSNEKINIGSINLESLTFTTQNLMEATTQSSRVVHKFENEIIEDLSVTIPLGQPFGEIYKVIKAYNNKIKKIEVIDEYIDKNAKTNVKTILLRINFATKTKRETEDIKINLLETLKNKNLLI